LLDRPCKSSGRVEFDAETWHALHQLSLDSAKSLQELADEAFRDLLKKASPTDNVERNAAGECSGITHHRQSPNKKEAFVMGLECGHR
jgi:hypothetical protein